MIEPLIYGLVDPRDGTVFYVGQTYRGRTEPEGYIKSRRWNMKRKVYRYLKDLHRLGLKASWEVLEVPALEDLDDAEIFWIGSLRSAGAVLTNISDGGRGNRCLVSTETRQKLSRSLKGNPKVGRPKTPEQRQHLRDVQLGKPDRKRTPEQRQRMSMGQKGRVFSDEHRARLSAAAVAKYAARRVARGVI